MQIIYFFVCYVDTIPVTIFLALNSSPPPKEEGVNNWGEKGFRRRFKILTLFRTKIFQKPYTVLV